MQEVGYLARKRFSTFGSYVARSFKGHYKVAGDYTFPLTDNPELPALKFSASDIVPQILLSPIIFFPAWICSLIVLPLFGNGALSLVNLGKRVVKVALFDTEISREINTEDDRKNLLQKAYGLPGAAIGFVGSFLVSIFIVLGRVAIEGWDTGVRTFTTVSNALVLHKSDQLTYRELEKDDSRHRLTKYLFGGLGFLIGGVLSIFVVAPLAVLVRTFLNSLTTFGRTVRVMTNAALASSDEFEHPADARVDEDNAPAKRLIYGFGLPGAVLGLVIGALSWTAVIAGRAASNTLKSMTATVVTMTRFALGKSLSDELIGKGFDTTTVDNEDGTKAEQGDTRSNAAKFGIGFIGAFIIGPIVGIIPVIAIAIARTIGNSALTLGRTVRVMTNAALAPSDEFEHPADDRINEDNTPAKRLIYGFGLPGAVLGLVIGALSWSTVIVGRAVSNTLKSMTAAVVTMTRFALGKSLSDKLIGKGFDTTTVDNEDGTKTEQGDTRSNAAKFGIGFIGAFIVGPIIGVIPVIAVAIARTIGNSALTLGRTVRVMTNAALASSDEFEHPADERVDKDNTPAKRLIYGFGLPGAVLGLVIGALSWGTVIAGRAASNTLKSMRATIVTMTRFALDKSLSDELIGKGFDTTTVDNEDGTKTEHGDTRSNAAKFGIGFIGAFIIGPIIGVIPVIAIAIARTIGNSALTFLHTVRTMFNVAVINENRYTNEDGSSIKDEREDRIYYGFGFVGLGLGALIGSVAAMAAASIESGKRLFSNMLSTVLNAEDKKWVAIAKADDRHPAVKYFLGLPGGVVVFFPAVVGMFLLGSARIATNTVKTAVGFFLTLTNFILYKTSGKSFYPELALQADKTRSLGLILLGSVGFILGGAAALVAGPVYLLKHIAVQTAKSWKALSGSIMNVALERVKFEGLAGDEKRNKINKALGFLGYIASVLVTPIIGLLVFVARNPIDILAGIGTVAVSPITAVIKPVYKAVKGHRFDGVPEDNIIQAFKNLYSSLTAAGEFGETIKDGQTGKKGLLAFIRKAFTVSVNTRTERVLNKLLKDPAVLNDDDAFKAKVKKVKSVYSANCMVSQESSKQKKSEVKQIANFVREYVKNYAPGEDKQVPKDIYATKSVRSTFFGKPREVLPVAAPVVDNSETPGIK